MRVVQHDCQRHASIFRIVLEIDVGQRLPVSVADDEAGVRRFDGPGRREVAHGNQSATYRAVIEILFGCLLHVTQNLAHSVPK